MNLLYPHPVSIHSLELFSRPLTCPDLCSHCTALALLGELNTTPMPCLALRIALQSIISSRWGNPEELMFNATAEFWLHVESQIGLTACLGPFHTVLPVPSSGTKPYCDVRSWDLWPVSLGEKVTTRATNPPCSSLTSSPQLWKKTFVSSRESSLPHPSKVVSSFEAST